MCQSVVTPKVPFIGDVTLRLEAGTDAVKSGEAKDKVYAKGIYLDVSELKADAEFTNIDIGIAVSQLNAGPDGKPVPGKPGIQPNTKANPYGFGQRAEQATLNNVEQKAWATTVSTFKLPDLHLSLSRGTSKECY